MLRLTGTTLVVGLGKSGFVRRAGAEGAGRDGRRNR
jgi:hypothetical protein